MAGQKRSVQELGLLHGDPATGANDACKLAQRSSRLLDVVQDVAAPDPVEARVGRVELGGITLAELETRGEGPVADQRARRLHALRRWLDAHDAPSWPDRLGEPDSEEPGTAPDVEAAGARGQVEVGDEDARFRLLEEVHALGLGLGHQCSPLVAQVRDPPVGSASRPIVSGFHIDHATIEWWT